MSEKLSRTPKQATPQAGAHTGRRAGKSGTREAIQAAASAQFAELGFDRTSIRSIAAQAGVDPALVKHFFGTKSQLFVVVTYPPFDPALIGQAIVTGPVETAGRRLAQLVTTVLDDPAIRARFIGLVRAAASEPDAAELVRDVFGSGPFAQIVNALGADDAPLRASLIGSQMVGLIMARYIVRVEPLASLPAAALIDAIAPTLQQYLTGPIAQEPRPTDANSSPSR